MGQSCCKESIPNTNTTEVEPDPENGEEKLNSESDSNSECNICACPVLEIPLAGNAFLTKSTNAHEVITENGLANWISPDSKCSVYFYLSEPGDFNLSLRLSVPGNDQSTIRVSIVGHDSGQPDTVQLCKIKGPNYHDVPIGQFTRASHGYVKIDLQGVSKSGNYFGDVSHVIITETSCSNLCCIGEDFYFGRRGPSVHLNYELTNCDEIEYFYNEITVPKGYDAIGSYFCAIAFGSGYFGIQVNSKSERRILFSIWSAYETDDPSQIPEEFQVKLKRKGENVITGEFGNEGSGGQSYLLHNWKTETKYKFLVRGMPLEDEENSEFTAWFYDPIESEEWKLISCFVQQKKSTYLTNIYSFCENFDPDNGHLCRKAFYGNQWAKDTNEEGGWKEITRVKFTGDTTSKRRLDFDGGVTNGLFYLKNCGFFNGTVATGQYFLRDSTNPNLIPEVELDELP